MKEGIIGGVAHRRVDESISEYDRSMREKGKSLSSLSGDGGDVHSVLRMAQSNILGMIEGGTHDTNALRLIHSSNRYRLLLAHMSSNASGEF